ARALGVLVVLDAHAPLAVQMNKASSPSVSASASVASGPLAIVERDDLPLLQRPPPRAPRIPGAPPVRLPAGPAITAGLDEDLELLDHRRAEQLRGLVIAGVGMGHVSPAAMPRLRRLLGGGMPVVVASRTVTGGTSTDHYAYPGSEVDLLEAGAVMAGLLPAPKARLLLQALLADGARTVRIREVIGAYAS